MEYIYSVILGVAMAVDCMCVGISDGILENNMKKWKILFISILFGFMQGLMPLLGYLLGNFVKEHTSSFPWDKVIPYISFVILLILGLKAIIETIIEQSKEKKKQLTGNNPDINDNKEADKETKNLKITEILVQSVATSIDAFTVGFTFIEEKNTLYTFITFGIIAIVTFGLTVTMIILGKKIGEKVSKYAPYISGIIFIALAIKFLIGAIV